MRSTTSKALALVMVVFFFFSLTITNTALVEEAKQLSSKLSSFYTFYFIIGYLTCAAAAIINFTPVGRLSFPLMFSLFFFNFAVGQAGDQTELIAILVTFFGLIFIGMLFAVICSYFNLESKKANTVLLMFIILIIVIFSFFNFIQFTEAAQLLKTYNSSKTPSLINDQQKIICLRDIITTLFIGISYIFAIATRVSERNN